MKRERAAGPSLESQFCGQLVSVRADDTHVTIEYFDGHNNVRRLHMRQATGKLLAATLAGKINLNAAPLISH